MDLIGDGLKLWNWKRGCGSDHSRDDEKSE
jgi:hypothetical protein